MNRTNTFLAMLFLSCAAACVDHGRLPVYLHVTSVRPAPNERNVDKGRYVVIGFSNNVHWSEFNKIHVRYVDDTAALPSYTGCGLVPPESPTACVGPFIWKPGRTVEVVIPNTITDVLGNRMKEDVVVRFEIARDTLPFQLVDSRPRHGDTISIGSSPFWPGHLQFSDYMSLRDSVLTTTPSGHLAHCAAVVNDTRQTPTNIACFSLVNLRPGLSYEITVPQGIRDYEGEMLMQEYRIRFYTKP